LRAKKGSEGACAVSIRKSQAVSLEPTQVVCLALPEPKAALRFLPDHLLECFALLLTTFDKPFDHLIGFIATRLASLDKIIYDGFSLFLC